MSTEDPQPTINEYAKKMVDADQPQNISHYLDFYAQNLKSILSKCTSAELPIEGTKLVLTNKDQDKIINWFQKAAKYIIAANAELDPPLLPDFLTAADLYLNTDAECQEDSELPYANFTGRDALYYLGQLATTKVV